DGTVSVLVNNQNGTFSVSPITVGSGPQALAITGTGASQLLAVANFGSNNVSVLKNNGSGTFAAQTTVSVGNGPDDVRIIDINADSIPDFIVSNYTDGTVNVATGSAGGTYTVLGPFTIGTKPYSAAAGDLDGSGTGDVVVANTFSNNTGVLLSGTQISVPYTGLSLPAGNTLNATYSPDGNSKYGASTSPNVTAP
ncbi:MAG: VCBS repeat-containing protein, partial [Alloacidobacterium sp.]